MSILKFGKTCNFITLFLITQINCLFPKILLAMYKNLYSNMKMPVFKIFAYKHFFVKTLVQISTSTEVNHLISKELYQKQIGFKFI